MEIVISTQKITIKITITITITKITITIAIKDISCMVAWRGVSNLSTSEFDVVAVANV